ncbi:MAG TPA: SDR family oxidoreductase [Candidatus Limnocylindria bacterium]|nr:SDR family oxidoreductase [Candidatus Limnocylindria bacterium]
MTTPAGAPEPLCLVTGATGYVGGRLVPELLAAGYRVRCLVRVAERLRDHPWAGQVEIIEGDASRAQDLDRALADVDVAYYLIHALGSDSFETEDRAMARGFGAAAERAGVGRIVYLGGLSPADEALSPHLRSRAEVGDILLASSVPTVVLRAAVIIGSGSASFEMLRYLTERLPVMVTPRWVANRIQPIAIRDVLRYLVGCAGLPPEVDRGFDIGGPDVLTYEEMMQAYALAAGLKRRVIIRVPVLSPTLSAHWVGVVTPVPGALAKPLVESLKHEVYCREHDIADWIPDPPEGLLPLADALRLALQRIRDARVDTRWSSASVPGTPSDPLPTDPDWAGGSLYEDSRRREVASSPAALWSVIEGIGGENGWYSFPLAWEVRGLLDRAVGGVGLRRGRRDPDHLYVGEALDFWRVEERRPEELLRLRAEMRLPGLAWLDLRVEHGDDGTTVYDQRALFHPRGLAGHLYWWSVAPFHGIVFGSMVRNIARAAEQREERESYSSEPEVTPSAS